jgi:hypothetical protein
VIKTIEIEGFKSLEKVRLELGGLNLFIGANASGKSNFFDALRVLQGIGYGFTVDEVFNGKPKGAGSEVWEGIRGGSLRAAFGGRKNPPAQIIHFALKIELDKLPGLDYGLDISPSEGVILGETLRAEGREIFDTTVHSVGIDQTSSALWGIASVGDGKIIRGCGQGLTGTQWVSPQPVVLRQYSQAQTGRWLGEHGENFAALVKSILGDHNLRTAYLSWLRQLTPMEFDDVTILEGALGEPLFALKEGNQILPAPILSDGTLRFAAITAAFFQPDMPGIITLEEIENGIHPSRLRLLVELLKSQTRGSGLQVFATTHSPVVLAWLDEEDYKTTFLCRRDAETGASVITPLSEIPHLIELVRKQPIGELFTEGWLEGAF